MGNNLSLHLHLVKIYLFSKFSPNPFFRLPSAVGLAVKNSSCENSIPLCFALRMGLAFHFYVSLCYIIRIHQNKHKVSITFLQGRNEVMFAK